MSSIVTSASAVEQRRLREARPRFFGLVGGELFKVSRMWSTWITLVLLLGAICLPYVITFTVSDVKESISNNAFAFLIREMQIGLGVLRVFIGFFLIILTANVFGREYQLGTIRILLARGVGRLQLLFAKLLSVVVVALLVFLVGVLLAALLTVALIALKAGNLNAFNALNGDFWRATGTYIETVLISMALTILLTVMMTSIGRSLTFGLSAGMAWFPADNILPTLLQIAFFLTKNVFWLNITQYFLGPNLNYMPVALVNIQGIQAIGTAPMHADAATGKLIEPPVDGTHTLLVALVYAVVFLAVSVYLTWKRDVKE